MTKQEFNKKQLENLGKVIYGPTPKTQKEKDIFNLKCMRYSIRHGSSNFRSGCITSLDRAIVALEKEK